MKLLLVILTIICLHNFSFAQGSSIDLQAIENQLQSKDGLGGRIHGNFKKESLFVFTWRDPNSFFVNLQMPLIPSNPKIAAQLVDLKRHDYIEMKGKFLKNDAPIPHVLVTEILKIDKWNGPSAQQDYVHKANMPQDLLNQSELIGKVHAVLAGGMGLVIEYKDVVIPVFTKSPNLTQNLYRNDKIRLKYTFQATPIRPTHLNIDTSKSDPLELLEPIVKDHGKEMEFTGTLVKFHKSPQITRNVFAIRVADSDGVQWNYTIVNFESIELFDAMTAKLEAFWDAHESTAVYDRNKFHNPKLKVSIKGLKNVISPKQANPQVLVEPVVFTDTDGTVFIDIKKSLKKIQLEVLP